jgi:hypothetical protein
VWLARFSGPKDENGRIGLAKEDVGVNPGKGDARMHGREMASAMCGDAIDFG